MRQHLSVCRLLFLVERVEWAEWVLVEWAVMEVVQEPVVEADQTILT
jgi:hypothetical protein